MVQKTIERNVMNMFDKLVKINCHSKNKLLKKIAGNLLEKFYCCEINCTEIDTSVLFAHHARGCTIIAAKICENVVIYQNVTIGSNLKFNKIKNEWENIGNPVIGKNVIIADGAKIFGPIVIGENSFVAAGSIITKDIPWNLYKRYTYTPYMLRNSLYHKELRQIHEKRRYTLVYLRKIHLIMCRKPPAMPGRLEKAIPCRA